jgi:uncharacterized protein YjbJ (UPF0337 family)
MSTFGDKVKGNWNQMKGMFQKKWADLTDDDLLYEEGRENELLGRIQKRTGATKEQIDSFIAGMKFD